MGFAKTASAAKKPARLRVGAFLCALMVCFCGMTTSLAAEDKETAKEKYERLKQELADISASLDGLKDDKSAAEAYRKQLAREKETVEELIAMTNNEIDTVRADLAQKETEIVEKRKVLEESKGQFEKRLVAIYKMNNSSMMAQVLSVDSFAELLQVMDAMQRISKHDTDLMAMLGEQRKELERQQAEIDAKLVELEDLYQTQQGQAQTLANNIVAQDGRISQAEADIAAQQVAMEDTNAALIQAQKEWEAEQRRIATIGSQKGDGSQYTGGAFLWPVPGYYNISCYFGAPDPNGVPHRGMDISSGGQTPPIVACADGTVITATYHNSYGNYVVLDHGGGLKTLYAHCSSLNVGVGQVVSQGETIAAVGSTGFSTGPHLHLEVHYGGLQNPLNYLQ